MIEISPEPIDAAKVTSAVDRPENGGLVTFQGVVRNHDQGRSVLCLEYECYREMALAEMAKIADEAKKRWNIRDIAMVHRVGRLEIGEVAVAIAVGSAHRKEAFEACQFAIDRVKQTVPIWKKEQYLDGAEWKSQ